MSQTTIALIARTTELMARETEIYSELKRLLGQNDILLRQDERWEDTLSRFESEPPHLIILDCPEPRVDGLVVCQGLRARYAGLLVVISECGDKPFHLLAMDLGADVSLPGTAGAPLVAAIVKALLRRFASIKPPAVMTFGKLSVNANRRDVLRRSLRKRPSF